jgi:hypothetical protein
MTHDDIGPTMVYVVQSPTCRNSDGQLRPCFDFSPAERFGHLSFLLSPSAAPFHNEGIVQELTERLAFFSDRDYLLLVGNPVLMSTCFAVAAKASGGKVKCLQWSGVDRNYVPIIVDLNC